MPWDPNNAEFTEFQLEEIALGRAQDARRRLAARAKREDDPVRKRLAQVREEIQGIQDALAAAGDVPDVRDLGDEMLARYLDGSLPGESRAKVEHALAQSAETRKRLIEMYQDVRACAEGEMLPRVDQPAATIVPYTSTQGSEPAPSHSILVAGLLGGLAFWGGSFFAPPAWQTPSAFASVAMVAFVVLHGSWRQVMSSISLGLRRVMLRLLVSVAAGGAALGLLNLGHVPSFCALVVSALVVLTAVRHAPSISAQTEARNAQDLTSSDAQKTDEKASKSLRR